MRTFRLEILRFRRVLGAILLAHLLAVMAMAASPALHALTHPQAHDRNHDCAVVLFTGGTAAAAVIVIFAVAKLTVSRIEAAPRGERVEGISRVLRILEHAPPAAA